jgi:diguanylate cyclase (GGDEF)-like protein
MRVIFLAGESQQDWGRGNGVGMTQQQEDEIARLRAELAAARARIVELEGLADHDALVPVLNRRGFVRELERAISAASRYATPSVLVYLDLVGFKRVNDTFGHAAGDAALVQAARVLAASTRLTDTVGRLGGDEFGVILGQCDLAAGERIAGRLVAAVAANPVTHAGRSVFIAASVGIADIAAAGDAALALERADQAMYAARRAAIKA